MREQSVPCRGSTLRESIAGLHRTFNDSAMCDRCERINAVTVSRVRTEIAARAARLARSEGVGEAPAASPTPTFASLLGDASRDPSANAVPATSREVLS